MKRKLSLLLCNCFLLLAARTFSQTIASVALSGTGVALSARSQTIGGRIVNGIVNLSWGASPTTGVTGYNVYRADCTGGISGNVCASAGTFAKINATPIAALTYADSSSTPGKTYDYYATAVCPTACSPSESGPSNHFGITVSTLTLTSVVRTPGGGNKVTVQANWTDVAGTMTTYTLSVTNGGAILDTAQVKGDVNGNYKMTWSGKVTPPSAGLIFKVCDIYWQCVSQNL